jgi:hypothetical protein
LEIYDCECTVKNDHQDPDLGDDGICKITDEEGGCVLLDIIAETAEFEVPIAHDPVAGAQIDLKPGACPNSWNRRSRGVLSVAIVGGAGDLDVNQIDPDTVVLSRADQKGSSENDPIGLRVAPNPGPTGPPGTKLADVATPFDGGVNDCHDLDGDGVTDLLLKFKSEDVVRELEMGDFQNGALVQLVVSGSLLDGTPFKASGDALRLVPAGAPPGELTVESNVREAWVGAQPLDAQLDGGGFATFERIYAQSSVVTLTAPEEQRGRSLRGWRLDGGSLIEGNSVSITISSSEHAVTAIYQAIGTGGGGCGLGAELAFLLLPLLRLRRLRARALAAAALLVLLLPAPGRAQDALDTDADGFPDAMELTGIPLHDGTTFPSCDGLLLRHQCVDPLSPDLFLVIERFDPGCDPAADPRCIPSSPGATDFISAPTNPDAPGGLGIAVHELLPSQVSTDPAEERRVSPDPASTQKAVKITEDRNPAADVLGRCPERATPNGDADCTVFTEKIHDYVMQVCAGSKSCKLATDDATVADDVIRTYVKHTLNHEISHGLLLSPICTRRYCDHEKAGAGVIMEESSKYTNKGGNVTWYISTQFGGPSQNDAALK